MDAVIVGAGGHGKVVLDILRCAHALNPAAPNPVGFLDADPALAGTTVAGLPVLGHINALPKLRQRGISSAIVAIGDANARLSYARVLREHDIQLINAVHPRATVSTSATLGVNLVIAAGAHVGAEAHIADSVIVNTAAVVEHECRIGPAAHICPGAVLAGRVTVGEAAFIGLGARIIQCLTIGPHTLVGAGAVVIRDLPENVTAAGVPARILRAHT